MKLTQNQKYILGGIIVVVIAALLIWRGGGTKQADRQENSAQNQQPENQNSSTQDTERTTEDDNTQNTYEGTLKISDDLKQGNLMLDTGQRIIYVFTSRDYSSLLGKSVALEIQGTLENFTLLDIKEK
ncbi:MAG: hypothetical protein COT92_03715 [Candidatus Doudnabacteria bacterium CG10_big_fil_rev_8_21_14_0_10_42_18]|uniref:Uncharacterized protein n=1 Tax=Candidatus Doudnabacteria bacterium CG10_big_fil_rev_8_21_14_0_10_42_18 TaxID=1974552 RepID=A0A2H0VA06_9BACT|nr:MAG: hypothetical protein COT92_03715 [Candidatus Doudnabacteria bacterium CG10_big_fil_rev_8_21_14_0_10_42_18]